MSKRFLKPSIKWIDLEKMVPPEQKNQFFAFKGKADGYLRRVIANPVEPPKINWEEYEKLVSVEGLVETFKICYEELKVPYPKDTHSCKVDEQWKTLQPKIKEYCDERQKEIDLANKELKRIEGLPKFEDITLEMFYDIYTKEALDPVKKPTFWPHNPEEQLGYVAVQPAAAKKA